MCKFSQFQIPYRYTKPHRIALATRRDDMGCLARASSERVDLLKPEG